MPIDDKQTKMADLEVTIRVTVEIDIVCARTPQQLNTFDFKNEVQTAESLIQVQMSSLVASDESLKSNVKRIAVRSLGAIAKWKWGE